MFFEERCHVSYRAAVRTKDRRELKTDVQPKKFEFRVNISHQKLRNCCVAKKVNEPYILCKISSF